MGLNFDTGGGEFSRQGAQVAGGCRGHADHRSHRGRTAYLAGFHAAQAFIFEKRGRTFKTHSGVQAEFARLVKDDPRCDIELRRFLGRTYNLKAIADYETGPRSRITSAQAQEAVEMAVRFVAAVTALIEP
jgi:uncharacterized protein (UPF0332 family)